MPARFDYIKEKQLETVLFIRKSSMIKRFTLNWFTSVINTLRN